MKNYPYSFENTGYSVLETVNQAIDLLDQRESLIKNMIKDCHDTQQENQSTCVLISFSGIKNMDTSIRVSDGAICLKHDSDGSSVKVTCPMWPYDHTPWEEAFDALINSLIRENNRIVKA